MLKFFCAMFCMGLINNLGFVMIAVSAQMIAEIYHQENLMPLFQLSLVLFTILALLINFRFLTHFNSMARMFTITSLMLITNLTMALCSANLGNWAFPVSLVATLMTGMIGGVGECVCLGIVRSFPAEYVVGFSSGTGFAGVFGASLQLVLYWAGFSLTDVFLAVSPVFPIYCILFYWVYRESEKLKKYNSEFLLEKEEKYENAVFSVEETKRILKEIGGVVYNLSSIYFLEYVIITGFADRVTLKQENGKFQFILLYLAYQFGVLLSRSSIKFFEFPKIYLINFLELMNFVVWWFEAEYMFLGPVFEVVLMVWVGCLGGLGYVNVAFEIMKNEKLQKEDKEAAVNFGLCFYTLGIFLASSFCLCYDNFL